MLHKLPRKYWILIAMSLVFAAFFLDQTAVTIALPTMQNQLNATNTQLQWIVNAYLLSTACLLMLGGKLGDLLGHKKLFFIGMGFFIVGSLCTALSPGIYSVIASRVIQGIGAALVIPPSGVIVFNSFTDSTRGRAMGAQVAIASLFLTLGPVIGALITHYYSWRVIFWINIPSGIFCLIIVHLALKNTKEKPRVALSKIHIDWPGLFFSSIAILCFTIALMQVNDWGWFNCRVISILLFGVVFTGIFYYYEKQQADPFVNFSLFRDKNFFISCLLLFLIQTNFIARVFVGIYLQSVLGYNITSAALLILPTTLPVLFAGPLGGYLQDKLGAKVPILIGLALITLSAFWIAGFAWVFNFWFILPALLLFSVGAPMVVSTCRTAALITIPKDMRGAATGICNTARQIGSTIGLAVVTALIYGLNNWHLNRYLDRAPDYLHQLTASDLSGILSHTEESMRHLANAGVLDQPIVLNQLHSAADRAFTLGFSSAMLLIGLLSVIGIVFSVRMPKKKPRIKSIKPISN